MTDQKKPAASPPKFAPRPPKTTTLKERQTVADRQANPVTQIKPLTKELLPPDAEVLPEGAKPSPPQGPSPQAKGNVAPKPHTQDQKPPQGATISAETEAKLRANFVTIEFNVRSTTGVGLWSLQGRRSSKIRGSFNSLADLVRFVEALG